MTNKDKLQPSPEQQQFKKLITSFLLNPPAELVNELSSAFPPDGYRIETVGDRAELRKALDQEQLVLNTLRTLFNKATKVK
jgi:hypothetical protein